MQRAYLLIVTSVVEVGAGLVLLAWPTAPLWLLLGVAQPAPETAWVARVAGAALLAIGVACWLGRKGPGHPAQFGLLAGVLLYDLAAAVLLACAGLFAGLVGVALWPVVLLHAGLASWCVVCLRGAPRGGG
jgi:hypothetical protein